MSFGDFFRSMFGFPRTHRPPDPNFGFNNDADHGEEGEPFDPFFGPQGPGAPRGGIFTWGGPGGSFHFGTFPPPPGGEGSSEEGPGLREGEGLHPPPFGHFGAGSDTSDMIRHFDEMFRSFDAVFRSMGMADFPTISPGMPSIEAPPSGEGGHHPSSPRDSMLKEPDSHLHPPGHHDNQRLEEGPQPGRRGTQEDSDRQQPAGPHLQPPSSPFDWFFSPPPQPSPPNMPQDPLDSDLDDEVRRGDLLQILRPDKPLFPGVGTEKSTPLFPGVRIMEPRTKTQPEGHIKSVRVYTYRSADGKTEERRTVEDGSGHRETTVTRSMGDQSHSVTTRRPGGKAAGEEEVIQHYHNMDENDKREFDERWRHPPHLQGRRENGSGHVFDLFKKGFPGFPSSKS